MATIMCLSDEMIAIILGYNDISIKDIINFRCVCKQFRWAAKYDKFWEKKFFQRWPTAKKLYDKLSKVNELKESQKNEQKDKKQLNFMDIGINCIRQFNFMSHIINRNYDNMSNFIMPDEQLFDSFFNIVKRLADKHIVQRHLRKLMYEPENGINILFLIDEIKYLITQSSQRVDCDMVERYCNIKLLTYLRRYLIRKKWDRLCKESREQQTHILYERTATTAAQWLQPQKNISYSSIKTSLDNIALEILNRLREKNPDHSIFSTSAEKFSYWKNNNIDDNHWNEAEGTQIMDTLKEHIFNKSNFRLPKLRQPEVKYECIDNVLENKIGEEIILLIIYHSVARRLGLRCDIGTHHQTVHFRHKPRISRQPLSIFWQPRYATNSSETVRCFSIKRKTNKLSDPCLQKKYCLGLGSEKQLLSAELMLKSVMGLTLPTNLETIYDTELIRCFYDKSFYDKIELRPQEVKFAVGMIVIHGNQSINSSTGVIIGWNQLNMHGRTCHYYEMLFRKTVSKNCSHFSYISLPKSSSNYSATKKRTYYAILNDNNEICYVEEGAVTLTMPKWINNDEIGYYFSKFENTHYVPNEMLAKVYPQDAAITAKTISKYLLRPYLFRERMEKHKNYSISPKSDASWRKNGVKRTRRSEN
ncbi:uncharacterized protein LOC115235648 [Formica exsecta]|uniref:uncharacterized protein LOC115235648 n=1 Tax=Formica exsecta TaxID=72781 RepID=UPI0011445587|nr:uncharacterized protein LOC115235648 [Formica exsecta]